ncbi:hypothetical protein PFISCL1PPCAC_14201, partial [Pristionchus fissidentatus]
RMKKEMRKREDKKTWKNLCVANQAKIAQELIGKSKVDQEVIRKDIDKSLTLVRAQVAEVTEKIVKEDKLLEQRNEKN